MRTQKQQQVVTTPVSGAPAPPYPVQYPVEHSEPPAEGSPEEVAWLRRRVRRLEQAFGSYAKEIARHNTEVAKVFAALSQGGEIKSEERTPGKISMADIAEFERCDEWEAFAAQESEGETGQKQDWPGFSPAKFVNVNEIDVTGEMQGKEQQAAFRTPLAERRKNVCTPGTDPLSGIQKHKMMTPTPATPMMDELPMDALDEVGVGGNADTGFTPPPSAMKFCPPPVTPSMHSMQSLESAACM